MTAVSLDDLTNLRKKLSAALNENDEYEAVFQYQQKYYRIRSVIASENMIYLIETDERGELVFHDDTNHFTIEPLQHFLDHARVVY